MLTLELAAARFLQVHELERTIRLTEQEIAKAQKDVADAEERLSELRKTKTSLMKDMREAAADESQLPLFDPVEVRRRLSVARAGHEERAHG